MQASPNPVKVLNNVLIPMRDGVKLSANIIRPDTDGQFPAILEYTPYHKPGSSEPGHRYRYFAERGYVLVNYDVRGTGDSEGVTTDVYQDPEIQDGCEVVEWIAQQSWSNGNVGMWGISYCGVVCWQVAAMAPPHLKAIIVRAGTDDPYTEWVYPGGSLRPYLFENYAPLITAYNFAPPNRERCGERWSNIWNQHLQGNSPWGIGFISNQLDGPYWRAKSARPDYDRIKCAVYVMDGWADWYPTSLLRAFSHLKVPRKALIGPWAHMWADGAIPGPRIDDLRECEKWFDQWLKGVDTGVTEEPRVTLFVRKYIKPDIVHMMDNGFWRSENEWPVARRCDTPFFLHANGRLSADPCESAEIQHDDYEYNPTVGFWSGRHGGGCFWPFGMPLDQRPDEALSLTYTTDPLQEELEVIGTPQAKLCVASTAEVAAFAVKLSDVAPDGTSAMVTRGYRNATCRESRTQPSLLEPGRIYELQIDLLSCAYVFQAGHRIRLTIAGADFPNAWPTPKPCTNSVFRGSEHPSMVLLPVIPPQDPPLPAPDLHPSAHPLPPREALVKPEYTLTHDVINGTATSSYRAGSGSGINVADYTVSTRNPAKASIKATYEYVDKQPDAEIRIETQCLLSSDESAFHHMEQVEVKVNGRPHFTKSWSTSVRRELSG